MHENELTLRREFEQMPSEQLRTMLRAETAKAVPDDDLVIAILHILEDREPDVLVPASRREEEAWKLFRKRVKARKKRAHFAWRSLANAAVLLLVVGLLIAVVPQEAEADSLWDVLVRWVSGSFDFTDPEENKHDFPFVFETNNPGLHQIYDAALELGIEQPLIPTWFPEEYVLDETISVSGHNDNYLAARFAGANKSAVFQIRVLEKDVLHGYFGEEEWYQQFEREGTEYKTMRNNDSWVAVWTIDKTEYFLTLDCQEDTLQSILDSIYVMEE